MNECDDNQGYCEQLCVNSEGSYECVCNIGYMLRADRLSCELIAQADSQFLYYFVHKLFAVQTYVPQFLIEIKNSAISYISYPRPTTHAVINLLITYL